MRRIVYYHKGCPDGFGAAWAAWKRLGSTADYIPLKHGEIVSDYSKCQIYFLDICPDLETLTRLQEENRVVILDHHKSSKNIVEACKEHIYDENRSGAGISWDYFFGSKRRPKVIDIIEDRDLWNWKVHGSREVLMILDSLDKKFEIWDDFAKEIECDSDESLSWGYERAIHSGSLIVNFQDQLVKLACSKSYKSVIAGIDAIFVNSSVLQSFIGNYVLEKEDADLAVIFYKKEEDYIFSLRSKKGGVDCSKIAQLYGGGGHQSASGFRHNSVDLL